MRYRLQVVSGHLIAHYPDSPRLLDTGAPVSVSASQELQDLVGTPFGEIAGLDLLDGLVLGFDCPAGQLVVNPDWPAVETVPLTRRHGIPLLTVTCGDRTVEAILDTGAQLSYAPASIIQDGRDPARRVDFAPGIASHLGEYEVDTAVVTVQVGAAVRDVRAAVPPPAIRNMLAALGMPEWILGSELFICGRVVLDLRDDRLLFAASTDTSSTSPL
jgi:hypothetical protein